MGTDSGNRLARWARAGRWLRARRAIFLRAAIAAPALAVASPNASAQTRVQVDQYTADDGLAQNTVRSVVQDSAGFLWVGTSRGLQRFDGYSFTSYAALDRNAPAELSGLIWAVRLGRRGALWVQAGNSLFELDPSSRRATRMPLDSLHFQWALDSAGDPWVSTPGRLKRIDTNGELRVIDVDPAAISIGIALMATSHAGGVWLVGDDSARRGTVQRVQPGQQRRMSYALDAVVTPLIALEDPDGRVWVGGSEGLDVLDPGADRFRAVPEFRGREIRVIESAHQGRVLVATTASLAHVDRQGRIVERWEVPQALASIPQDMAIDRDGGVWLATYAGGLFRLDARRPLFEHLSRESPSLSALGSSFVTALVERGDGALWIGTVNAGVYRVTDDGRTTTSFRHDSASATSISADHIWDLEEDAAGNLWVGTANGLCQALARGFHCHGKSHAAAGLADIAKAPDGWFWLARAERGAIAFDPASGRFGSPLSIPGEVIMAVHVDPDSSVLWLGGSGLFQASVSRGAVTSPVRRVDASVMSDRWVYALFRDSQRVLWVGTELGLQRWDPARRAFAPVDVPELRGSTVFSMQEDADQRLWLGTAHGLVSYSPITGIARRYRREDGVRSGEFNRRAAARTASGEMLFGGVQGITRFRPDAITGRRAAPPIVITRLRTLTARGIEDSPIVRPESVSVRLVPGDRAVTIEFAALSYTAGPARRYRYRLEGLSDEWIESNDHVVTYPTPAPGRYVFHVQAAGGSEDEWSATSLWSLHRLRLARAVATERLRVRISRDLHDEIGAGLSSIALMSDAVGTNGNGIDEPDRRELKRIAGTARDMVGDLRDIVWSIDPDADQLEDIVARMRDVAADLLRGIPVTFRSPPGTDLTRKISMEARRDLLLLYKEALHNVARHSRATSVTIELHVQRAGLELFVSDDGVGFTPQDATLGMGLRSLRERAERLGARLALESEPGRGTTVRVQLETT
jgi:signal transduction histidine kinase